MAVNIPDLRTLTPGELLLSLLIAFRFDAATAVLCFGAAWLVQGVPLPLAARRRRGLVLGLAFVGLGLATIPNTIDIVFYHFSGRRAAHDLLWLPADVGNQGAGLALMYWPLAILGFGIWGLGWSWLKRAAPWQPDVLNSFHWLVFLGFVGLCAVAARGGLQLRPLHPAMAFAVPKSVAGALAGNSTYLLAHALVERPERPITWMADPDALYEARQAILRSTDRVPEPDRYPLYRQTRWPALPDSLILHDSSSADQRATPPNVLIVVMESLSGRYTGTLEGHTPEQSLTPHFDRLAKQGVLFTNFYSNGTRSIEAFSGLLAGLPEVSDRFIIGSPTETAITRGLGTLLGEAGYETAFFHGGANGTMGLDGFSNICGFTQYYGLNQYPSSVRAAHHDNTWGIADHHYFPYVHQRLRQLRQPFCGVVFSLSHHHPFHLVNTPETQDLLCQHRPVEEKTLLYADRALGRLADSVLADPRLQNTWLVITGDHPFLFKAEDARTPFDTRHVPLLILAPRKLRPARISTVGKASDLPATLLHLLGLESAHATAGRSLFEAGAHHWALFGRDGLYGWVTDSTGLLTDFDHKNFVYLATPHQPGRYSSTGQPVPPTHPEVRRACGVTQTLRNLPTQHRLSPSRAKPNS
jgi:phosphoglycerol transferase MdoB-like AlkP superfamily enzyme